MSKNNIMQTAIEPIDASQPTIFVRRSVATISDLALTELKAIAECRSDALRRWLHDVVNAELNRRQADDADSIEPVLGTCRGIAGTTTNYRRRWRRLTLGMTCRRRSMQPSCCVKFIGQS